jgi:DNA polymerase III delta prime subunit
VSEIFAGLPPQPEAQRLLAAAVDQPGHAYLLTGPAGTGKLEHAERFAAELLGSRLGRICARGRGRIDPDR